MEPDASSSTCRFVTVESNDRDGKSRSPRWGRGGCEGEIRGEGEGIGVLYRGEGWEPPPPPPPPPRATAAPEKAAAPAVAAAPAQACGRCWLRAGLRRLQWRTIQ
eukprot:scaffold81833_cov40-Phaeocystis_antarctica.AAC.2